MSDLASEIQAQIQKLSLDPGALQAELSKLLQRKEALKNRAKNPQTKEQRTAAYIKARGAEGSPERAKWDADRKRQAEARKAKEKAKIDLIEAQYRAGNLHLDESQLKLLGINP